MLTWWEKTVEYKFILSLSEAKRLFLAPLDGSHERAGDALISAGSKWLLIEFKRDVDSVKSELEKFNNFAAAQSALRNMDRHHFLVYGLINSKERLSLGAITYFSHTCPGSIADLLSSGAELDEFSSYLQTFVSYKKEPKGGGGSGQNFSDFSLVAGVAEDGNVVSCMSIRDFGLAIGLDLMKMPERTRYMGGPSR